MDITEQLEPLHALTRELTEQDRAGRPNPLTYTDNDVIAALLVFNHIMNNRLVAKLTDEKVGIGMAQTIVANYTLLTKDLVLGMTGIDSATYYKSKGEAK